VCRSGDASYLVADTGSGDGPRGGDLACGVTVMTLEIPEYCQLLHTSRPIGVREVVIVRVEDKQTNMQFLFRVENIEVEIYMLTGHFLFRTSTESLQCLPRERLIYQAMVEIFS
jgi:hypothetical protein